MKQRIIHFLPVAVVVVASGWFLFPKRQPLPYVPLKNRPVEVPAKAIEEPPPKVNVTELEPVRLAEPETHRELSLNLNDLRRRPSLKGAALNVTPYFEPHTVGLQAKLAF